MELEELLETQAADILAEDRTGWGNTMFAASSEIARLKSINTELVTAVKNTIKILDRNKSAVLTYTQHQGGEMEIIKMEEWNYE
jgi:hypothetical protein